VHDLICDSLGPHESVPNGISAGSAIFMGLTNVTNIITETDNDK